MPSYIAESNLPRTRRGGLSLLATRARDDARTLAEEGQDVTYLRSAFTGSGIAMSGSRVRTTPEPGRLGSGGQSYAAPAAFSASGEGRVTT